METKGPINPPGNNSYIHVMVDAFGHSIVPVPIKSNNAKTDVMSLLNHWITKFGPPIYLVTDRGQNMLTLIWNNFAHSLKFVTLLELFTLLGQMD